MKYTIGVTRLAIVHQQIEVKARSPEAAAKKALMVARDYGTNGWDVDDVYNDKQPYCMISANTCFDEDGNDHDVEEEIMP